jgi:hypothetical protein
MLVFVEMSVRSFVILALTLASLIPSSESTVVDCAQGKSLFTINSQGFSPEPPIPNENSTLWIDYTIPGGTNINAGTCVYSFSLNGIPFTPSKEDLCTQVSCPLVAGNYNLSSTSTWPDGISGKVVTKIEWYDQSNNLLLCSQTTEKVQ